MSSVFIPTKFNELSLLHPLILQRALELDPSKEWRPMYNNYLVSNYGDVYSMFVERFLSISRNEEGYLGVRININEQRKHYFVSRLTYMAFKNEEIPEGLDIDHMDRDLSNNHINNLRAVTKKENAQNSRHPGHTPAKIEQYTLDGTYIKTWTSIKEITETLKVSYNSIADCYKGKSKQSHGFIWKNLNIIEDDTGFVSIKMKDAEEYKEYRINREGIIIHGKKFLHPLSHKGYLTIPIRGRSFYVHRLVAQTFIENPNNYPEVNHINKVITDNNVSNLEWCTKQQNITHAVGKKVNKIDINTNEIIETFDSISNAARSIIPSHNCLKSYATGISDVCKGKLLTSHGFKWEFVE
jgi:hypothetical protein